ncbi:MAG: helix-turn-helix transcriptional regulator [Firmicutes bacterium]|nr:helix-turn-helix transcriptional regulator [Bacillota bacterium]
MKVSKKIINIRNENNLTQEELAETLCVSRQTISNWENDKCYPDIETLIIIGDKFNISLDVLLKEDKEMVKDISKKIKSNKEKKIIIVTLILILVFMIWFSYKIFLLCYYDNNYNIDLMNNYIDNLEEIFVKTDTGLANQKITTMNIYIPEELIYDSFGNYDYGLIRAIEINKYSTLFTTLINNQVFLKGINYESIFKKYNINNPNDIINYFKNNYKNKKNIFRSKNKMELQFLAEYFVATEINTSGNNRKHYYWNNDTEGYMMEGQYDYIICVYNQDETYSIRINKNFYNLDDVMNILKSIYFE